MRLETTRLSLIPLTRDQLREYLEDPAALERELGFLVSRDLITDRVRRAIGMKLDRMDGTVETRQVWLTYWLIVLKEVTFGAGMAGFKGFPDRQGETEIGYGIDSAYQRQGYMKEAVQALITWAFREPACNSIVARDVRKANVASQHVLANAGMTVYEENEDTLSMRIFRAEIPQQ